MRENFTPFEQKIIRDLSLNSNKKIMPFDFIAKHMDAIAIELDEDDKFVIVTNTDFSDNPFEYFLAEKSILDLMYIISYLEQENLIVPLYYTDKKLKVEDQIIRIFDKDKYQYNEKTGKEANFKLTEEEFFEALKAGRYTQTITINNKHVERFDIENKEKSAIYISNFIKKHYGCFLYVSPALVELVENDFKTHDQIRFEDQMDDAKTKQKEAMSKAKIQIWYSQGAFYVSLLAFLVSLVSTIITQCFNDNKLLRNEIRSVKRETPRLVNQLINRDTINVSIIKK